MSTVRVALRVRPLNKREKQLSSKVIVHVNGSTTSIYKPPSVGEDELKDRGKAFCFDFSYDSTNRESPTFSSQEKIFMDLGSDVLKAAFEGFNACVFAYGQTGSGKSYTMMGHMGDKGLIPRICEGLFWEISQRSGSDAVSFHTEVSYLEIYNERVQDLLRPRAAPSDGAGLKVREHPTDGPYVQNLSKHVINNHSDMEDLITLGNASRTTASTGMNDQSSRSHAILTINFTQAWFEMDLPRETLSKIHLVDLAGSERADATCTTGIRLKEGANINKSLVTLGSVIAALADLGGGGQTTKRKKHVFIPYRDSVLTWLLKDSLGGNSVTTMIATISPADVNYGETLSTLRYASRAKNIINCPTVNEDDGAKVIRELQAEVARLQRLLEAGANQVSRGESSSSSSSSSPAVEELHKNEAKVLALTEEWASKWTETQSILQVESVALRREGGSGVALHCRLPHLIGVGKDLLGSGIVLYHLKEGRSLVGSDSASCNQDIALRGPGLLCEHCVLENRAGSVTLIPGEGALCSVNGSVVTAPCPLTQGSIIQLGGGTTLRFNHPAEAARLREECQSGLMSDSSLSLTDTSKSTESLSKVMLQDSGLMDKLAAHTEESKGPGHCLASAITKKLTAIPVKGPVPHTRSAADGGTLQGGVSTREGHDQERESCHKSRPGLMSERPWREAGSGDGAPTRSGDEVWSGDASLQQTSVLGPGDGCGMKPEGNANEIQGVVADCYKGRPGSGGSSLGSASHLQSSTGTGSTSVLPRTGARSGIDKKPLSGRAPRHPPEQTTFPGGEMDESGRREEIPGVSTTETAAAPHSRLGSLVGRVSWMVQDAGRLLWSPRTVLRRVREEGLGYFGTRHVVSLVRESNVVSVVKESQVFAMVRGSFVFSLLKDSRILSTVKDLPLTQHIQMKITQQLQPETINPDAARLADPTSTLSKAGEFPDEGSEISERIRTRNGSQEMTGIHIETQKDNAKTDQSACDDEKEEDLRTMLDRGDVQIFSQRLIRFPNSLLNLQTLPLSDLLNVINSLICTLVIPSQRIVTLLWVNVAKCSQPEPRPGLLILAESGLYTLTSDSGPLLWFHHLPLLQLKEVQIGLAGQSLCLMGSTEHSILGVYTHNHKITRELCWAILGTMSPGDIRVRQHPLLHADLMEMSLKWETYVPDLLMDAGFKVCFHFQKSLAALVYLIHCNMETERSPLAEIQLVMYTSVRECTSPRVNSEAVAQLFLTHTHIGLVQEEVVLPPTSGCSTVRHRPQFHHLILRQRLDVRCVLVHDGEDERGAVRLDVILANVRGRGHPESATEAAAPPARASNPSPHAEVWKLTFSCSTEAARLINHLSNV